MGSSITLSQIMASHFYHASKDTKIVFYRAMRKYKLENYSLASPAPAARSDASRLRRDAIIEFCVPDLIVCSDLEQKWMDYYKPRYNVLKIAGSSSGFRHSIETINKLKELLKKENHPARSRARPPPRGGLNMVVLPLLKQDKLLGTVLKNFIVLRLIRLKG